MPVERYLEILREDLENCDIAAFGDLSSGLILRSNTAVPCRREVLDALCEKAAESFSLLEGVDLPDGVDATVFGSCAIEFGRDHARIFSRSLDAESDFVCARLSKTVLDPAAVQLCRAAAERIQKETE